MRLQRSIVTQLFCISCLFQIYRVNRTRLSKVIALDVNDVNMRLWITVRYVVEMRMN